jgi:hypothetical protein
MANGKGSGRRPAAVGDSHIATEWQRIFGGSVVPVELYREETPDGKVYVESEYRLVWQPDILGTERTLEGDSYRVHTRIFSPEVICPGCHHCQPATGPLPLQRPAQPIARKPETT